MGDKDTDRTGFERRDRFIKELEHDPYAVRRKPREPAVCPGCGAVFSEGRWHWTETVPEGAHKSLCAACQRIRDRVPAGYLTLKGGFVKTHRDEILHLIHNREDLEKKEHPMNRIMNIEETGDGMVITFTDTHLPRGVGKALHDAFEGELEVRYPEEGNIVRVTWVREE